MMKFQDLLVASPHKLLRWVATLSSMDQLCSVQGRRTSERCAIMAESLLSVVKTPIWSRNQHLRFLFMSNLTIADQKIVGRIENAMAFGCNIDWTGPT
jgi:hypothetical protein